MLTESGYLAVERAAVFKSEFCQGEVFAMAGGTRRHSLITSNLIREFGDKLEGRPCVPYGSDLRVKVEASGLLTYPDMSVACGEQRFLDSEEDTLINPVLIVEVLSDSTEAYDRGRKFDHYQQIPSLREYLLISQSEPRLDLFIRQPGGEWLLRSFSGLRATVKIPSLKMVVSLSKVFARIQFERPRIRPRAKPGT